MEARHRWASARLIPPAVRTPRTSGRWARRAQQLSEVAVPAGSGMEPGAQVGRAGGGCGAHVGGRGTRWGGQLGGEGCHRRGGGRPGNRWAEWRRPRRFCLRTLGAGTEASVPAPRPLVVTGLPCREAAPHPFGPPQLRIAPAGACPSPGWAIPATSGCGYGPGAQAPGPLVLPPCPRKAGKPQGAGAPGSK